MITDTAIERKVGRSLLRLHLNGPFVLDRLIEFQRAIAILAVFYANEVDPLLKHVAPRRTAAVKVAELLTTLAALTAVAERDEREGDEEPTDPLMLAKGAATALEAWREQALFDELKVRYPSFTDLLQWTLQAPHLSFVHNLEIRTRNQFFETALHNRRSSILVRRMSFGSPGSVDFAGMGSSLGHLKDFLLSLLTIYVDRRKRDAEVRQLNQDIAMREVELVQKRFDLYRHMGYSEDVCRALCFEVGPAVEVVASLMKERFITGIEEIKETDE